MTTNKTSMNQLINIRAVLKNFKCKDDAINNGVKLELKVVHIGLTIPDWTNAEIYRVRQEEVAPSSA